jgi:hypothetical protein
MMAELKVMSESDRDTLVHNAAFRIMPTEPVVIWRLAAVPGPLGLPLARPTRHNPDILSGS